MSIACKLPTKSCLGVLLRWPLHEPALKDLANMQEILLNNSIVKKRKFIYF